MNSNKKSLLTSLNAGKIVAFCVFLLLVIPSLIWLVGLSNKNANFVQYQTNSYTFYYPKGWSISKNAMTNVNGTAFFLQPPDAAPPKTPHVDIEVAAANPTSINDMTDAFTIFKYTKATTSINGITMQKYTTIVPSSEGVLHSIAYVFERKGNIYLIGLGYKQQETDSQLENEFSQIVTTFTTH